MMINGKFLPDKLTTPGETLKEMLDSLDMTQLELSKRIAVTPKHINKILKGEASITVETALKFENIFELPAKFWLNLESDYQENLARLNEIESIKLDAEIAKLIPYSTMAKFEWVPKTIKIEEKILNLREFFKVSNLNQIELVYDCAFRAKNSENKSLYAQAAWIARGERVAAEITTEPFNRKKLIELMKTFRLLTKEEPATFQPKLVQQCAECGVALVFIPRLPKTFVHGVTKWISKEKVLVQLSLRGKYSDIFWFSLFHELAHVLLHGKRIIHLEKDEKDDIAYETEADEFASNILIPKSKYDAFIKTQTIDATSMKKFADSINIDIGIVISRLMHDGILKFNEYENLRTKYDWQ